MSQNLGSLPPLSHNVTLRRPPPPLTCDVIYGWPQRRYEIFKMLTGKPTGQRFLGRPRRRWEDNDDMGDSEMMPGAVHKSPVICLTAEENPEKAQLEDHLTKFCNQLSPQNGVPYIHEVDRIAQHVRKGEGRKGRGL